MNYLEIGIWRLKIAEFNSGREGVNKEIMTAQLKKGFTLIELLIVMAILGVLAVVLKESELP